MNYKAYKIDDNCYKILEVPLPIGEWYFDSQCFKEKIVIEDWLQITQDLKKLFDTALELFEIYFEIIIRIDHVNYIRANFDNYEELLFNTIQNSLNLNLIAISIKCSGCPILEDGLRINSRLFEIDISRTNKIGLSINTKNICFLPCNPIEKVRQYNIWKENAPLLAHLIYNFSRKTKLSLLTEVGEMFRFGCISSNLFYLSNKSITGIDWDEFHVPFELLNEKDYNFMI